MRSSRTSSAATISCGLPGAGRRPPRPISTSAWTSRWPTRSSSSPTSADFLIDAARPWKSPVEGPRRTGKAVAEGGPFGGFGRRDDEEDVEVQLVEAMQGVVEPRLGEVGSEQLDPVAEGDRLGRRRGAEDEQARALRLAESGQVGERAEVHRGRRGVM